MKTTAYGLLLAGFLLTVFSCKKPYLPGVAAANPGYLVVEGVINSGRDSTIILLSHTIELNSEINNPETGARVTVESDKTDQFSLTETVGGTYVIANLNLPVDRNYRLHIFTSTNKEYVSNFVANKTTPPIDSIEFAPLKSGVQFYINSHDNGNKTRYYRWTYDETWSYFSAKYSQLIYKNNQVSFRDPDSPSVSTCYKHATPSNSVFVSSSDKLADDIISNVPLGYVDASTGKLTHVYSLLVKQYALTAEAYKYWQLLKTNTEKLGSIFDAQPSSSITNIHAANNFNEPVIGYISVSTVTTKRIFVQGRDLPPFVLARSPGLPDNVSCAEGVIHIKPLATFDDRLHRALNNGDTLLTIADTDPATHQIDRYLYAPAICVDCRLLGGTNIKPSYWP